VRRYTSSSRYPEYKDSGIEWLGEIPAHWKIVPLKRKAMYISRGNAPRYVDESEIRVLNQACIYWDGIHLANVKYQETTDISQWKGVLRNGDVVINSTGTGTLGRAAIFEESGPFIADAHVTIVRLKESQKTPRYLRYLLEMPVYQGYIQTTLVSGSTNQIELSHEGLASMAVIVPPSTEMNVITLFLDRETAKIDALVEKKEQLIELLQEKRTALISHAVTKGLDPNVPMKDSGIEWLGEIPAHWKTVQLRRVVKSIRNGTTANQIEHGQTNYPVTRIETISQGTVDLNKVGYVEYVPDLEHYRLQRGDVLFSHINSLPMMGNCALYELVKPLFAGMNLLRLRPNHIVTGYWLWNWMRSSFVRQTVRSRAKPSINQASLPIGSLKEICVLVPPSTEQRSITSFLSRETAKIDALITKIEKAIKLLKEYRTALISAAVTGKIDVRRLAEKRESKLSER